MPIYYIRDSRLCLKQIHKYIKKTLPNIKAVLNSRAILHLNVKQRYERCLNELSLPMFVNYSYFHNNKSRIANFEYKGKEISIYLNCLEDEAIGQYKTAMLSVQQRY